MPTWTPKMDLISGLPLLHLTFILNEFLHTMRFHIEMIEEREVFGGVMDVHPLMPLHLYPSGSLMEGVAIPEYQLRSETHENAWSFMLPDIDYMYIDSDYLVCQGDTNIISEVPNNKIPLVMEDSGCSNGYVRLRKSQELDGAAEMGTFFKTSDISEDKRRCITSLSPLFGRIEQHGPSSRKVRNRMDKNNPDHGSLLYDCDCAADNVYAVRYDKWPEQATEWTRRQRPSGWPSQAFTKEAVTNGCHLVQVAHPSSSNPEEEWRLSFSVVERALVRSLSAVQRKCYVLFKIAVKFALEQSEILSSYYLKTVMLWTCEEIPATKFTEYTVGGRYLDLLDKLITFLTDKNLPNYFVFRNNMISHCLPSDIEAALIKIRQLRALPLEVFLQFDERNRFGDCSPSGRISEIMGDVFDDVIRIRQGQSTLGIRKVFENSFYTRHVANIINHRFLEALDNLIQLMSFKHAIYGADPDIRIPLEYLVREHTPQLQSTPLSCYIFWQFCLHTRPTVNIKKDISTVAFQRSFFSSLARYFLRRLSEIKELSLVQKAELDKCIYHSFGETVINVKPSSRDILDSYGWLYLDRNNFNENYIVEYDVLQMLQFNLRTEQPAFAIWRFDFEEWITFNIEDRHLIHDPLLKIEFEGAGYIRVPTTVYLQYLIAVRAVKLHGHRSHEALFNTSLMISECVRYKGKPNFGQTLRFTGYVCMYAGVFMDAFMCFDLALFVEGKSPRAHLMYISLGVMAYEALINLPVISLNDWYRRCTYHTSLRVFWAMYGASIMEMYEVGSMVSHVQWIVGYHG